MESITAKERRTSRAEICGYEFDKRMLPSEEQVKIAEEFVHDIEMLCPEEAVARRNVIRLATRLASTGERIKEWFKLQENEGKEEHVGFVEMLGGVGAYVYSRLYGDELSYTIEPVFFDQSKD